MAEGFGEDLVRLIEDLRRMPETMKGEAKQLIPAEANAMAAEVKAKYRVRTGAMVRGVIVEQLGPLWYKVRSRTKQAHFWEFGFRNVPAEPNFIPARVRHQKRLEQKFVDLLKRAKVRGMTGSAV